MTIKEILEKDGILVYKTKGTSMLPMLRENRDVVIVRKKGNERLKKYDVALYKRPGNKDYVLHRVVAVEKDGYTMIGDHQWVKEKHVPDDWIVGVLSSFIRDGEEISVTDSRYEQYVRSLSDSSLIRRCKLLAAAVKRKISKKKQKQEND